MKKEYTAEEFRSFVHSIAHEASELIFKRVSEDEWKNSFTKFLYDMGPRPLGLELDRINNDGPYSKDNCRWASRTEQSRNRRYVINLTYKGKTQCITEWEDELGLHRQLVQGRYWKGERDLERLFRASDHKFTNSRS